MVCDCCHWVLQHLTYMPIYARGFLCTCPYMLGGMTTVKCKSHQLPKAILTANGMKSLLMVTLSCSVYKHTDQRSPDIYMQFNSLVWGLLTVAPIICSSRVLFHNTLQTRARKMKDHTKVNAIAHACRSVLL